MAQAGPSTERSLYTPSAWGTEFHALTVDEALGAGAAGPGKSFVLLMDCNERIFREHERSKLPHNHPLYQALGDSTGWALHLRRTRPMLDQTISRAKRIFYGMDPKVKWSEQKTTFTFSSGYKYQFGHCKDQDDWEQYQSNEYDWIGFDELTQFNWEQYTQVKTRKRSSDPLLRTMLKVRAMSNPLMRKESSENFAINDPHWVRKYFVDPHPDGRKIMVRRVKRKDGRVEKLTCIYLPATLYDNPDKDFVDQYERELLGQPDHIRAALLYGNWYATADSYFGQHWRKELHVCEPFAIPSDWYQFRSMDWGYRAHGCVHWHAMSPEGTQYVHREMTFIMKKAPEVAKMVLEQEERMGLSIKDGSKLTGPADTQLWEERGNRGKSMAEEFAAEGVIWEKADKNRQRNGQRLTERLRDHNGGVTTPGIVFFRNCVMLIKTLPSVGTDPKNPMAPAQGGEDHWVDSAMYSMGHSSREHTAGDYEDADEWRFKDKEKPKPQERGQLGYGQW